MAKKDKVDEEIKLLSDEIKRKISSNDSEWIADIKSRSQDKGLPIFLAETGGYHNNVQVVGLGRYDIVGVSVKALGPDGVELFSIRKDNSSKKSLGMKVILKYEKHLQEFNKERERSKREHLLDAIKLHAPGVSYG